MSCDFLCVSKPFVSNRLLNSVLHKTALTTAFRMLYSPGNETIMISAFNGCVRMSERVEKLSAVRTYLMGMAMMLIILYHCGVYPFKMFGYWGVDVFLFLSGFGIFFALKKRVLAAFLL